MNQPKDRAVLWPDATQTSSDTWKKVRDNLVRSQAKTGKARNTWKLGSSVESERAANLTLWE